MADPSLDIFSALGDWAFKALTGVLAVFGWDAVNRIKKLEETKHSVNDAARERTELKQDIAALSLRMDTQHESLRKSIDERAGELRERLDTIMDRVGGSNR
jgi:hypothetical protein